MAHMTPQNDHETVQIKPKSHVNFFFYFQETLHIVSEENAPRHLFQNFSISF